MITDKLQSAINDQINKELYSAYLYLAMAAWADQNNYPGFAHWLRLQSEEEVTHGLKLRQFLLDRGAENILHKIDAPPRSWDTPQQMFDAVLEHERLVTASIFKLNELASEERSYAAHAQLQWFINEQVEEEKNADLIAAQLHMAGSDSAALMLLDRELGGRALEQGA